MPQFLSDVDIFTLLGLSSLSEVEKENFMLKLSKVVLNKALKEAVLTQAITEMKLQELETLIANTEKSPAQIQQELISKVPGLESLLTSEANKMKKEALISQVSSFIKYISNNNLQASPEDVKVLYELISLLQNEDPKYSLTMSVYNALKTKFNFVG